MTHWQDEIPSDLLQQALLLQELLIARATGGPEENSRYSAVRSVFWEQEALRGLLPDFVQRHRSLGTFWPFIKDQFQTYAERRAYIAEAFLPLLDYLEGRGRGRTMHATAKPCARSTLKAFIRLGPRPLHGGIRTPMAQSPAPAHC